MPYNVISTKDARTVLTHWLTASEALKVTAQQEAKEFSVRVVSIDGVDLTTERLQRIALLEAPLGPPKQAA